MTQPRCAQRADSQSRSEAPVFTSSPSLPVLLSALGLAAGLLGFTADAQALSCQKRIVSRGDSQARVRALCGEPVQVDEAVLERSRMVLRAGPGRTVVGDQVAYSVVVAKWTYDFGPQRLMQELTFENGTLTQLRTLGRGGLPTVQARASQRRLPSGAADRYAHRIRRFLRAV